MLCQLIRWGTVECDYVWLRNSASNNTKTIMWQKNRLIDSGSIFGLIFEKKRSVPVIFMEKLKRKKIWEKKFKDRSKNKHKIIHTRACTHTHIHTQSLKTSVKREARSIINWYLMTITIRSVDVMMNPIFQNCFL